MNKKRSSRSKPNFAERSMGVQSKTTSQAQDFFSNLLARTGAGTSSLENGTTYNIERWSLGYWNVLSTYEVSWVARRIVEAPAADIVKTWPTILGETDPEDSAKMDRAIRKTNTKNQVLEGLTLGRLFGGAGALIVIKGHEKKLDEPLNLDEVELGSYKGLSVFDRWSGIYPDASVCSDIERPLDFGLPEFYEVRGKENASFRVHSSRILRFCGPMMPEPERSAYSGWGMSCLAPVIQSIVSYDNVSYNALSLSYRAQIIGMRMPELAALQSGLSGNQASAQRFGQRMQSVNEMLSNQSLVLLEKDGELSKIDYSFSGLYELIQAFQLQLAGAAKMPVSLLWGRTLNGLGTTGDGDERIYEKTVATESNTTLRPALEKLYPVIATSELGEVPDDMDLDFPSIRVLTEQEKAELAKATVDSVTVCINTGIMSPRGGATEVKRAASTTGFGGSITNEAIEKLSDDVQAEGELGEGLFGEEGGKTLDPSGSPTAALKETDKLKAGKGSPEAPGSRGGAAEGPQDTPEEDDEHDENGLLRDPDEVRPVARAKPRPAPPKTEAKDEDGPSRGDLTVHGIPLTIETRKGEMRGNKYGPLPYHYGYIRGIKGNDGDSMDFALGPEPESTWAYVFDQNHMGTKNFDEHKVFLGYPSLDAAQKAFAAGHDKAHLVYRDVTPMQIDDLKTWLRKGNHTKPIGAAK
jgi:hypothetical protein